MAPDAIIFDFDGVIIDTETPDFESWRDVYRERGQDFSADLWGRQVGAAPGEVFFDPADYYRQLAGSDLDSATLEYRRKLYL
ncbi:MAG TPA: hypothetical protein VMT34_05915, partial [Aggregatilineales bacterium]|nr:hypothetical protein [Aggregatilineales bacterium]